MKTKQSKFKPSVIDLFSGCGGLSFGFINAGYEVLLGADNDPAALKTFQANHNNSKILETDLSRSSAIRKIKALVGRESVDVIAAGPPCQGFSLTGPRRVNDRRNRLFLAVVRAVREFRPRALLIENVPGLASLYGGRIKDEIIRTFEELDYNMAAPKILCAADFGVPQLRRRVFFVGLRRELGEYSFPEPTCASDRYITCFEAIGDLPSREHDLGSETDRYTAAPQTPYQKRMRRGCARLCNHTATNHTEMVRGVIALVPEGGDYRNLPPGIGESRRFNEAWTRYHSEKPAWTIDTGHRNHFHYKYNRVPTVRENARLQSFPDSFVFYGSRTQQYRQVGDAVPPLMAYHIARKLLSYICPRSRN